MLRITTRVVMVAMAMVIVGAAAAIAAPVPVEKGSATPAQFEPSINCGCHGELQQQWSVSMHAQALNDPIYRAKRDQAAAATDGVLGPFCDKCHAPIAAMTGELGSETMSPAATESVTCMFCHQTVGLVDDKAANTSHLVEADLTRRAQLQDPKAPHPAVYSEFHKTSEVCGGCHNVDHPINGMHLEATYSEWKASPWAAEGVQCQDCHMSEGAGKIGPFSGQAAAGGPTRDNLYKMTFVGGNAILGPADLAVARLQSAAELKLDAVDVVAPGTEASVTVTITNTGAGHYLPTGLTEVREMWLEVFAEDASGNKVVVGEHRFGTILQDDNGKAPVELWEATSIKSDDRIAPRESSTDSFSFAMPEGTDSASLTAALYYRSVPDDLAEAAGVENPVTTMASQSLQVFGSEEAKAAAAQPAESEGPKLTWPIVAVLAVVAFGAGLALSMARKRKAS